MVNAMNNKPAYTPGPWLARIPHCVRSAKSGVGLLFVPSIAESTTSNEDAANLRLAAAAPEMYEMIKHIYTELEAGKWPDEIRFDEAAMQAIIAKVEGK